MVSFFPLSLDSYTAMAPPLACDDPLFISQSSSTNELLRLAETKAPPNSAFPSRKLDPAICRVELTIETALDLPVKTHVNTISRVNGIYFDTPTLQSGLKIRGIPKVKLNVEPSSSKMQLVAYLYDVAPNGMGTLITHGPVTLHNASKNKTQSVEWELVATAYDVPAGHKVGVAFDTFDILYGVPTILPYSVEFKFKNGLDSSLSLPTVD